MMVTPWTTLTMDVPWTTEVSTITEGEALTVVGDAVGVVCCTGLFEVAVVSVAGAATVVGGAAACVVGVGEAGGIAGVAAAFVGLAGVGDV